MHQRLKSLGWTDSFEAAFARFDNDGLKPGRVGRVYPDRIEVHTADGALGGFLAGNLLNRIEGDSHLRPVTGDWVACRFNPGDDRALVVDVLPRRNCFFRQRAGRRREPQHIAANIDVLFILTGLDRDFNLKRIERYLVTARESGVTPVMLLTKADLEHDPEAQSARTAYHAPGVPIHAVSAVTGYGLEALSAYLEPGITIAMIGSSGSGKSTLLNALMGRDEQRTAVVRASDGRGRHTTTDRSLHVLPGGTVFIDNPGLREVRVWDGGESADDSGAFSDIEPLTNQCRFSDCTHQSEPGCAVKAAIAEGQITPERYQSYLQLTGELAQSRKDRMQAKHERMKAIAKFSRARMKHKRKGPAP